MRLIQLKISLLLILALQASLKAETPSVQDWQRCLGGSQQDIPGDIIRTVNGNLLLVSNIDSHDGDVQTLNHGSTDVWLTKLDDSGRIIWQRSFGGTSVDVGTGLIELSNGSIIISGYSSSTNGDFPNNLGSYDAFMLCTDSQGNLLWSKRFGGNLPDFCYTSLRTNDGGIVLAGGSYSLNGDLTINYGDQDIWIFKTDSNGNVLWEKSFGGNNLDVCYSLAEDINGFLYACGTTNSNSGNIQAVHGNYDYCVLKTDLNGNHLWSRTFGGSDYECAQTILIDSRNHVLVGGYSLSHDGDLNGNLGMGDSWLIGIDASGTLNFQQYTGGSNNDYLFDISETDDGGYLFASGSSSSDNMIHNHLGGEDIWMVKTDSLFHTLWSRNYGGTGNERPLKLINNNDGGFLLTGYSFSNNTDVLGNHGSSDIWLLNTACRTPTAFFTTPSIACLGDTISICNSSVNSTACVWLLNNTFLSSDQTVSIVLNTPGFQNLSITSQTCNNTSIYTTDFQVYDCKLPFISFSANRKSLCEGSYVDFSDASLNATSWLWSFPGGNPSTSVLPNPTVYYNNSGVYDVILTAYNGYGSQSSFRYHFINVYPSPTQPVVTTSGNILQSGPAINYQWILNGNPIMNAESQTWTATASGYYTLEITDMNGCSSESTPVYISLTGTGSLKDKESGIHFNNPAKEILKLEMNQTIRGNIEIINNLGQIVIETILDGNQPFKDIHVGNIKPGCYWLLIKQENDESIVKTIIII